MKRDQLIKILSSLPENTEIYVRQGDNAYPARVQAFDEGPVVLYVMADVKKADEHRNYPEDYGLKPLALAR